MQIRRRQLASAVLAADPQARVEQDAAQLAAAVANLDPAVDDLADDVAAHAADRLARPYPPCRFARASMRQMSRSSRTWSAVTVQKRREQPAMVRVRRAAGLRESKRPTASRDYATR